MTDDRAIATGQNSGKEGAVRGQARLDYRENASMYRMKTPRSHPLVDGLAAEAERVKLPPRNHTMLPRGQFRDVLVDFAYHW